MKLNFNHPVKELIWAGARESTVSQDVGTYFGGTPGFVITPYSNLFKRNALGDGTYCLTLNGHNRFKRRNYKYFTRTQVWEHHTGYGGTTPQDSIAVYSFALKPEEHQPSGTCNFSRIDTAFLVEADATTTADINIYAVNYNVLRIMSGMGGLAYSN